MKTPLENVIVVTNSLTFAPKSDVGLTIPYYVNASATEQDLRDLHVLICDKYRRYAQDDRNDMDPPMAGLARATLDPVPGLDSSVLARTIFLIHASDLDQAYAQGLNPIRLVIGKGPVLWGTHMWFAGSLINRDPHNEARPCSIQALRDQGVVI